MSLPSMRDYISTVAAAVPDDALTTLTVVLVVVIALFYLLILERSISAFKNVFSEKCIQTEIYDMYASFIEHDNIACQAGLHFNGSGCGD